MRVVIVPFLAIPSGSGLIDFRLLHAFESFRAAFPQNYYEVVERSLLTAAFNRLYAHALNLRAQGVTHFVMLHDDVFPFDADGKSWAALLLEEQEALGLGALSVLIPIRGPGNETSTALDGDQPTRFPIDGIDGTLTSVQEPRLLINTGCLSIDLRQPWAERIYFHIKDGIRRNKAGEFEAFVEPEDWELSRMLKRMGVPFGVTAKVGVAHFGRTPFARRPMAAQSEVV